MCQSSTPSGLLDYVIHFPWVTPTVINITPFQGYEEPKVRPENSGEFE